MLALCSLYLVGVGMTIPRDASWRYTMLKMVGGLSLGYWIGVHYA